jgi:hypothetical protein
VKNWVYLNFCFNFICFHKSDTFIHFENTLWNKFLIYVFPKFSKKNSQNNVNSLPPPQKELVMIVSHHFSGVGSHEQSMLQAWSIIRQGTPIKSSLKATGILLGDICFPYFCLLGRSVQSPCGCCTISANPHQWPGRLPSIMAPSLAATGSPNRNFLQFSTRKIWFLQSTRGSERQHKFRIMHNFFYIQMWSIAKTG